jgi:N4-gp56 family major capsid protein
MAQTTKSLVVVPEVWGDQAQAKFTGAVKVLTSGAVIYDNTLEGNPGDTVHFPKWNAIGELDDLTEGTPMTPVAMGTTDSTAVIKEAGKAVEITDTAALTSLSDPGSEARRQFGVLAARKLDADLISTAVAAGSLTLAPTAGTALSWSVVVDGIAKFGDEWDPADFAGLYIRSEQMATLFKDSQFIDASKLGAETPVRSGQIGAIGGLPVFLTNRLATNKVAIMKKNVLGALYKRRPLVETDRDILARSTVITTTQHYATKRLDDNGVLVITLS